VPRKQAAEHGALVAFRARNHQRFRGLELLRVSDLLPASECPIVFVLISRRLAAELTAKPRGVESHCFGNCAGGGAVDGVAKASDRGDHLRGEVPLDIDYELALRTFHFVRVASAVCHRDAYEEKKNKEKKKKKK